MLTDGAAILAILLYSQHEFSLGSLDTYLNKKIFSKKKTKKKNKYLQGIPCAVNFKDAYDAYTNELHQIMEQK